MGKAVSKIGPTGRITIALDRDLVEYVEGQHITGEAMSTTLNRIVRDAMHDRVGSPMRAAPRKAGLTP